MNNSDVILRLVDMLIAEKEKNFVLQQHQPKAGQTKSEDEKLSKD